MTNQAHCVDPRHDRVHTADAGLIRWRESYYFLAYDFRNQIGVCSSIGCRPAKGYSGSMHHIWGDGTSILVAMEKARVREHVDRHEVAGLEYVPGDPFGEWNIRFDGQLNNGGDAVVTTLAAMTESAAFDGETVPVRYDLTFTPTQPPYQYREDPGWDGLFDGHLDEVGRVHGQLSIDGRTVDFDGRGSKDHSWGVREWGRPRGWRWVDMLFEDGPEVTLWRATFDGVTWIADGAVFDRGVAEPITGFRESVQWARREPADRPEEWSFEIVSASHRLKGTAQIVNVVPVIFPVRDAFSGAKAVTWNDRALFRCALENGREGAGSVEFQFRVPDTGRAPRPLTAAEL